MMKILSVVVCLGSTAIAVASAAGPTTRPVVLAPTTPVYPTEPPLMIDPSKPGFIPKFARPSANPVGHFEERQYAYRFGQPGPFLYGYGGCGSYGYSNYGFGFGWRP